MGESAEGKGLGRVWGRSWKVWVRIGGGLGTLGVGGRLGGFWGICLGGGWQIRLGNRLIQGLSKAYPLSPE